MARHGLSPVSPRLGRAPIFSHSIHIGINGQAGSPSLIGIIHVKRRPLGFSMLSIDYGIIDVI
jgi:hypothetical protein